ncbi:hypothetical protein DLJ53_21150 [Acuticoccus sediminis]|uniref:YjiS-like domain-containing protein n=1 Tax=Acuticoccus sediminis TaxID=2184697 RepID=A0A8B2NKS7_9HYPH|nr:DUF1127 domain-containing protein [Acuticoccus sediminis]RAI00215.1 hypothetical protein DLJ53_21150 [Acuticoccus sediminis]
MTTNTTVARSRGTSILGAIAQKLRHAYTIRRRRAAFARMLNLDHHVLEDIGLTRADIYWGMSLPLEENAAVVVRNKRIADRRYGR